VSIPGARRYAVACNHTSAHQRNLVF